MRARSDGQLVARAFDDLDRLEELAQRVLEPPQHLEGAPTPELQPPPKGGHIGDASKSQPRLVMRQRVGRAAAAPRRIAQRQQRIGLDERPVGATRRHQRVAGRVRGGRRTAGGQMDARGEHAGSGGGRDVAPRSRILERGRRVAACGVEIAPPNLELTQREEPGHATGEVIEAPGGVRRSRELRGRGAHVARRQVELSKRVRRVDVLADEPRALVDGHGR